MKNTNYTKKLIENKNLILNHFAEKSPNFYFNFLTTKPMVGTMNFGTREQWSGCHCRVQYFENHGKAVIDGKITDKDYKEFAVAKAYYITFNAYNDYRNQKEGFGYLSVSLRADLVDFWAQTEVSNCYVLFVSSLDGKVYEMPVKSVVDYVLKNKDSCKVCYNGFLDYIIPVCNETVEYESKQIGYELRTMTYDVQYYKPEYIANFTYSVYRRGTAIKVGMFSASGKFMNERVFRSISELYDKIEKVYKKSKKTLQRQIAREEAIKLENGMMIIISSDLDKNFNDADYVFTEVVDEWIENALFCEDQPEDPISNPRKLPVKSHYEPNKKEREDWEKHFDDVQETEFYDEDTELNIRDAIAEAMSIINVKEKQEAYLKAMQEFHKKLAMEVEATMPKTSDYIEEKRDSLF